VLPTILPLFTQGSVCAPKVTEHGLIAYFANSLVLPFTTTLYLVYWGKWLDLTCGTLSWPRTLVKRWQQ
jgi:hypothetical protein